MITDLVARVERREVGSDQIILDMMAEKGFNLNTPNNVTDRDVHIVYCKWCLKAQSFPVHLAMQVRGWTCTTCKPTPSIRQVARRIMGDMGDPYLKVVEEDLKACPRKLLDDDPSAVLTSLLYVILR